MAQPTTAAPGGAANAPYTADLGNSLNSIVDDNGAGTTYVCEAIPGSKATDQVWRVARIVVSGTVTETRYAGTGGFDQVAANRANLSY